MSARLGFVLFVALAALFLFVNRDAYRGYFQDDEIDNLSWVGYGPASEYLKAALSPKFERYNFRPVGHFYFRESERFFGLDFPRYVAALHVIHLVNVWLLWMIARRLGAGRFAAAAGCVFFAFHMALFDAVWKPMYVFDLLCATLCLASLLLYARGQWILSLVSFWLAYKAKEMAVMLPLVLACYEMWFGKRRWERLAPFFAVSLSFGIQGLLMNPNHDNDYTFRFTPAALAKTGRFYAARVFLVPYLGFVLPVMALAARNRRAWFGLAAMAAFFFPLLFLPGRLFSAYCYVPFTGLAMAFSGIAEAVSPAGVVLFFLLWIPQDVHWFRLQRRETLARDAQIREWMTTLAAYAKSGERVDAFVFDGAPPGFARWGVEGAVKYLFHRLDAKVQSASDAERPAGRVALLRWDVAESRLHIETLQ